MAPRDEDTPLTSVSEEEPQYVALARLHLSYRSNFFPFFRDARFEDLQRASQDLERRLYDQRSSDQTPRGKYEADMDRARNILQHNFRKERGCGEKLEKLPKATQTNLPPPLSAISQSSVPKPISVRQDSNVSSDSFSQTSSPSYTSKTMEAPLLPHKHGKVPGTRVHLIPARLSDVL